MSLRKAVRQYGVPRATLQRHMKENNTERRLGRFRTVFSSEQEELLADHLKKMDRMFYGLTMDALQKLAFEYAERNDIDNPFRKGKAGKGWIHNFMLRHPEMTLRKPEATSIGRLAGFNKPQVDRFFDLLRHMYIKCNLRAKDVYNCDEKGIKTKILTIKGKRQVGVVASAERGRTITTICCSNAEGQFIPPALIFPRKRMNDPRLMDGAPPGARGMCSDSGWVNSDLFLEWLSFFVDQVKPSEEHSALLVLDNHESHRAFQVLDYATTHHVQLLTVPPHTTHRLQPMDLTVYGPLAIYFEQAVDVFQKNHPSRRIQMTDMAKLFNDAYPRACTVKNAVSGLVKSGICPYNPHVFTDEDFDAAMVTDKAEEIDNDQPADEQDEQQVDVVVHQADIHVEMQQVNVGSQHLDIDVGQVEVGGQDEDVGGQQAEVDGQQTEIGRHHEEAAGQQVDVGEQNIEIGGKQVGGKQLDPVVVGKQVSGKQLDPVVGGKQVGGKQLDPVVGGKQVGGKQLDPVVGGKQLDPMVGGKRVGGKQLDPVVGGKQLDPVVGGKQIGGKQLDPVVGGKQVGGKQLDPVVGGKRVGGKQLDPVVGGKQVGGKQLDPVVGGGGTGRWATDEVGRKRGGVKKVTVGGTKVEAGGDILSLSGPHVNEGGENVVGEQEEVGEQMLEVGGRQQIGTPSDIMPLPKARQHPILGKKRKTMRSEILTSSPVKQIAKDRVKKRDSIKKSVRQVGRRRPRPISNPQPSTSKGANPQYSCLVCGEDYSEPIIEDWIQCKSCHDWAHENCTAYEGGIFICKNC